MAQTRLSVYLCISERQNLCPQNSKKLVDKEIVYNLKLVEHIFSFLIHLLINPKGYSIYTHKMKV